MPLRLPINDIFKGERGGQSMGGKLEAGAIKVKVLSVLNMIFAIAYVPP